MSHALKNNKFKLLSDERFLFKKKKGNMKERQRDDKEKTEQQRGKGKLIRLVCASSRKIQEKIK
jgi:hypothetical protein